MDSVLSQTYKNLQIILVDDGSPDASPQICNEYAGKDQWIFVIHKRNGCMSSARNATLDMDQGELTLLEKEYLRFEGWSVSRLFERSLFSDLRFPEEVSIGGDWLQSAEGCEISDRKSLGINNEVSEF